MTEQLVSICVLCKKPLKRQSKIGYCKSCRQKNPVEQRTCSNCGATYQHRLFIGGRLNNTSRCGLCKRKATNVEKYGVEYIAQVESIKEKGRETNLKKYGVEYASSAQEIKEKRINTFIERYGSLYVETQEYKDKARSTFLQKYGVEHALQMKDCLEKAKQTTLERYGAPFFAQTREFHKNKQTRYSVDNVSFDSSWELAFYLYCKDKNITIHRNSSEFFIYTYEGRDHRFFPDFVVEGQFVEIKGDYLLEMHEKERIKMELCSQESIKVLKKKEMMPIIDYAISSYGRDFTSQFKCR